MNEYMIQFNGDPHDVLVWLKTNIKVHNLSPSGCSGLDEHGNFVWRFPTIGASINRNVLFNDEKYACWFKLRWS